MKKIFWIPFGWTVLKTYKTPLKVQEILDSRIAPEPWFRIRRTVTSYFEGRRTGNTFRIARTINYKNSFRPYLYGRIEDSGGETLIQIRLMPHPLVIAFMAVWSCVFLSPMLFSVYLFVSILVEEEAFPILPQVPLIPVGCVAIFYLFVIVFFNFEANKSLNLLEEILDASKESF